MPRGDLAFARANLWHALAWHGIRVASPAGVLSLRYRRRKPEETVLYRTVQDHLATFLERARHPGTGSPLPSFVGEEFERYLRCGILAHGFARVWCKTCKHEKLVGFS